MNATTKSLLRVENSKFSVSPEFPSWGVSVKKFGLNSLIILIFFHKGPQLCFLVQFFLDMESYT